MRRAVYTLVVLAALVLAGTAEARPGVYATPHLPELLDRWERIVGYEPCEGKVRVRWGNPRGRFLAYADSDPVARISAGRSVWRAVDCRITLDKRLRYGMFAKPGVLCTILAHELGHFAFRRHTRRGVMSKHYTGVYRWCTPESDKPRGYHR